MQKRGTQVLEDRIVELITSYPAQLSRTKLRDYYSGKTKQLQASEAEVSDATNCLVASGLIVQRKPTAEERANNNLHQNIKEVLVLGEVPGRESGK